MFIILFLDIVHEQSRTSFKSVERWGCRQSQSVKCLLWKNKGPDPLEAHANIQGQQHLPPTPELGKWRQRITFRILQSSQDQWVHSRFSKRLCHKNKVKRDWGRYLMSTSGLYMHVHTCVHTHEYVDHTHWQKRGGERERETERGEQRNEWIRWWDWPHRKGTKPVTWVLCGKCTCTNLSTFFMIMWLEEKIDQVGGLVSRGT